MLVVFVESIVKPECVELFVAATKENAKDSLTEPGIARFDVMRDEGNSNRFILVEVYRDAQAPAAHKQTAHYAKWRDAVADMMQAPRSSTKYRNVFPGESGWDAANKA
jgi:(4S)-4-hydroxy-5-phosphonooxypentane-2,3-dione isomerase